MIIRRHEDLRATRMRVRTLDAAPISDDNFIGGEVDELDSTQIRGFLNALKKKITIYRDGINRQGFWATLFADVGWGGSGFFGRAWATATLGKIELLLAQAEIANQSLQQFLDDVYTVDLGVHRKQLISGVLASHQILCEPFATLAQAEDILVARALVAGR